MGFWRWNLYFIYIGRSRKFGESFDKAWRKTAFSWKLGGLNCWLAMSCFKGDRRQMSPEFRCGSVRTGRRRWARTNVKSKTPHVNVQPPQNEFWWSLRRADVPCQAPVSYQKFPHMIQHRAPRKFFVEMAKVWPKKFWGQRMAVPRRKN